MKKINWGIIGSGNIVNKNASIFNSFPNSHIVAIMGRNKSTLKEVSEKNKINNVYTDIDEFLNNNEINCVYIATPPGTHLEYAKKCCDAGLITYLEKPIGRNYKETCEIVNIFKNANVPLYIAHFFRSLSKIQKIKSLIEDDCIGKVSSVDIKIDRKFNMSTLDSWLYETKISGGGKFYDIAPHIIDILVYLFGGFEEVSGIASNNLNKYKVEDIVAMIFKTQSGIIGTMNFNAIALEKKDVVEIYGTKGKIQFSFRDDSSILIFNNDGKQEIRVEEKEAIQTAMIENVINSILNNINVNICTGENALETYRIIELVLEKYYNGRKDAFWEREETWEYKKEN